MAFSVLPELERKQYRKYEVHLTNGEILFHYENYSCGDRITRAYESSRNDDICILYDVTIGRKTYVRKKDIYYIVVVGYWIP